MGDWGFSGLSAGEMSDCSHFPSKMKVRCKNLKLCLQGCAPPKTSCAHGSAQSNKILKVLFYVGAVTACV